MARPGEPFVTAETPITVVIVDDHDVVRRGLVELLEADGDIAVVGEAATLGDAFIVTQRECPAVVVLDVRLPDGTGMDLARQLRSSCPNSRCLMLTSFADDQALIEAADAGAAAYLLKEVKGTAIVEAVRSVAAGVVFLDAATVRLARARVARNELIIPDVLTPQERKIFRLIGDGRSNRQIGAELHLAEKTIKNYVTNMLSKLGMARRTEVAAMAARIQEHQRQRFS
jgi:two-component system response regulator DevR